jgi:restriction system protein
VIRVAALLKPMKQNQLSTVRLGSVRVLDRQGLIEDLMNLGLRVPPRIGIALAALSWMILHVVASQTVVVVGGFLPGDIAAVAQQSLIHIVATLLQYAVPFCLTVGVVASWIRRRRARTVLANARENPKVAVAAMSWREFERLVGEAFRQRGFAVAQLGGNGPDGGVDLILEKDAKRYLVQCKHWKSWQVGVSVIRELNGVIAAQEADGGYVVTGGRFTNDAQTFADSCGIKLVDGTKLDNWIKNVEDPLTTLPCQAASKLSCPVCGAAMAKKVANQGQFRGQPFWSCSTFPKCRGKLHIDRVA